MRLTRLVLGGLALCAIVVLGPLLVYEPGKARAAETISPDQKKAFEELIRNYIMDHPEVMLESLERWQTRQKAEADRKSEAAIVKSRAVLENNPTSPVAGNRDGDVTIVEFFDYRCGYCKRVFPAIQKLLKTDGGIRYVFKEFPVLGPESVIAAQAAQAVWHVDPDRYLDFHTALMTNRGGITEDKVLDIAAKVGVDREKVRKEMKGPKVAEVIKQNLDLGRTLNINGTPAFVIGGRLVPGAIDLDTMKELVAEARRSS
jgi:protein-disulfide isomerase